MVINVISNLGCQRNLAGNVRTKHEGKYPCDECDYQGNGKKQLKAHIESIHLNIKYPCEYCEYKATARSGLKEHIRWQHQQFYKANS